MGWNCRNKIITLLCFILIYGNATGQGVKIKTYSSKDSVAIRWAPSNYSEWVKGNKYGYKLERFLVSKDEKIVDIRSMTILHEGVIKPLEEKDWLPVIKKDSTFAPIALQALWGKTFELSTSFKSNVTELYDKVRENESRFGFAMYCADRSLAVAQALGVYFVDKRISTNEKYIYRVYLNAPVSEASDTAYIVVDPNLRSDLIIPRKPVSQQNGNRILLTWNCIGNDYVGYQVERSDDGRKYKVLNRDLVIPFLDKGNAVAFYSDTTLSMGGRYFYRIIGITPFQQKGPYSDTIQAKLLSNIPAPEEVDSKVVNGQVVLSWKYAKDVKELSHFTVLKSNTISGPYRIVASNIDANLRSWADKELLGGYYKVAAIVKDGGIKESLETFAQLDDETPPEPPKGLAGQADTTGIVRLKWIPNTEKDLLGYRVFRSNDINGGFAQISQKVIVDNAFVDTISLITITKNVYYKLAAVDKRYNSSSFSDVYKIGRPDLIRPAPPVLTEVTNSAKGRVLKWIPSVSEDVKKNIIYRITEKDTVVFVSGGLKSSVEDTIDLAEGILAKYYMVAVDSAENCSEKSNCWVTKNKETSIMQEQLKLKGYVSNEKDGLKIKLEWTSPKNNSTFSIYKNVQNRGFIHYKTLKNVTRLVDSQIFQGEDVKYIVRCLGESGIKISSNELKIILL